MPKVLTRIATSIDHKLYLILSDLTGPGFRSHLRLGKLLSMIFALQIRTEFSIAI